MDVLFLTFNDCKNDGRTKDLLQVASMLGDVFMIGISSSNVENNQIKGRILMSKDTRKSNLYLKFFFLSMKIMLKYQPKCVFVDNYHAAFPAYLFKLLSESTTIIQDVRELYNYKSLPTIAGKFLVYCEKKLIKLADVVVCANKYRSFIVKGLYNLKELPLVYENIHWISRHTIHCKKNTVKVVSTDGLMKNRCLEKFLLSKKQLNKNIEFYLVGKYAQDEYQYTMKLIEENSLDNVYVFDKMPREQLGNFLAECDIGVVKYSYDDLNNLFCASGKVYEFLMSGLPVVTTEHFDLIELCSQYGVGVADNCFSDGIKKIIQNYEFYSENVKKIQSTLMSRDYHRELYNMICFRLDKS